MTSLPAAAKTSEPSKPTGQSATQPAAPNSRFPEGEIEQGLTAQIQIQEAAIGSERIEQA